MKLQPGKKIYLIPYFLLSWAVVCLGQSLNFVSGYTYSIPSFDHYNQALNLSNDLNDWDIRSFKEINNMHGATFGIRHRTDRGFIGIAWEQKLKSIRAERTTDGRDLSERWSLSWTSITLESALTAGPISAGIGLSTSTFSNKLEASYNEPRLKLLTHHTFGNFFFLEISIGRPASVQLVLRPFYQFAWKDLNYKNTTFLIAGLEPNYKEKQHFWGVSLLLVNGPK